MVISRPAPATERFCVVRHMERISESPAGADVIKSMAASNQMGMDLLGLKDLAASPQSIVEAIDTFVYRWQKGNRPADKSIDPEDVPFSLGSLWAEQLIRQFGWTWIKVTFLDRKNSVAHAVASPDRSLVIYPIHFLIGCFRDPGVDATILLSFNMLLGGRVDPLTPNSYENLMASVHRIVPRA